MIENMKFIYLFFLFFIKNSLQTSINIKLKMFRLKLFIWYFDGNVAVSN